MFKTDNDLGGEGEGRCFAKIENNRTRDSDSDIEIFCIQLLSHQIFLSS